MSAGRGISAPSQPLPPGAWDTHAHVFGPFDSFPVAADSRYQPPLAPRTLHAQMLSTAGFSRGVVVHGSANGFDNSGTLDAVAHGDARLRAVAVVSPGVSDDELLRLHVQGVRALRFTETGEAIGAPHPSGILGLQDLQAFAPRLRALGWHAQIWARCDHLASHADWLAQAGVPVVIDHMGFFDAARGVADPAFQSLLGLLDRGSVWVKLTPIRVTKQRWNGCEDVRAFHDALLARAPDRMLWGSDWPYIGLDKDLPDVGALIDLFDRWVGDGALRDKVFVSNPAALYGEG